MLRCGEEHQKREELLKSPATISRVHGFAMFLAELYSTFRMTDDKPLDILRKKLLEMLMTLIKHGSDDSLLYAGRILKVNTGDCRQDHTLRNFSFSANRSAHHHFVILFFLSCQPKLQTSPNCFQT